jgi:hypothetical protein
MRMKILCLATLLSLASLSDGCITNAVEVSEATKPFEPGSYEVVGETSGFAWAGFMYIINVYPMKIPWGVEDPAGDARDSAIANGGGGAGLIDVRMDRTFIFIPIPFWHFVLTLTNVEGKLVRPKATPPPGGGQ